MSPLAVCVPTIKAAHTSSVGRIGGKDGYTNTTPGRNGFIQSFHTVSNYTISHVAIGLAAFTGEYTIDLVDDNFSVVYTTTGPVSVANSGATLTPIPLLWPFTITAAEAFFWLQVTARYDYTGTAASTPHAGVTPLTMQAQYGGTAYDTFLRSGGTSEQSWKATPAGQGQFGSVTDGDWAPLATSMEHPDIRFAVYQTV